LGLGIIPIWGEITSVKYYYELLGFATDEPNRSGSGNLLFGLVEPKAGPFGRVRIISQQLPLNLITIKSYKGKYCNIKYKILI